MDAGGLVAPLMLAALTARWASSWLMDEPLYHYLSRSWRLDAREPQPGR